MLKQIIGAWNNKFAPRNWTAMSTKPGWEMRRWGPNGWERRPPTAEEIKAADAEDADWMSAIK